MKLDRLGPPPIEPLSDIAWSRVERGLWARLDATAPATPQRRALPRWAWLAAPALAAAVIAIVVGVGGDDPTLEPARVVSNEAPSSIAFGDAHVTLDPQSAVVLDRDGASALLERGSAWFAIAPRAGRAPFVVRAGDATIRVIGTRFRVGRSAEVITVEVERGIIELQHHELSLELRDGQRWSSAEPQTSALDPPAPPPQAEPTIDPEPQLDPQPEPQVKPRPRRDPKAPKVEAKAEPKTEAKIDRRASFERLAANEARDPKAAITGYLELAKGKDAWAELSLFSAARLAHDRKDPRAKSLLERYIARYPRGANVDDARELLASVIR